TMGIVETLLKRGHRVRVLSDETTRQEIDNAGGAFVSWRSAPVFGGEEERGFGDWALPNFQEVMRQLLVPLSCNAAGGFARDVIAEIDRQRPDLVVNFDMMLGPITGCEARGVPVVNLMTAIAHAPFPLPGQPPFGMGLAPPKTSAEQAEQERIAREYNAILDSGLDALNATRAELGLKPLAHVADQERTLSMRFLGTAQAFDFAPDPLPPKIRYVGPLIRDPVWAQQWQSPWPASDKRPLIVVGFSTSFQNHVACLQRVIDACAELPVRALVTLGPALRKGELEARANTQIVESAPHDIVMREAALVVNHGGHGTVMTALMHRLPQLILPHGRDQGDNAVRITERSAGLSVPNTASTEEMRAALLRLLNEPSFAAGARKLGDAVAREVEHSTLITDLEALATQGPRDAA
ncbi:MAG TPA: nucleotide disphospho-sugar-binding domain-containing protein, partial [Alphaproteobacteria bacterium]|nr:nucleotide disphospho-sugar-binding domain-containing protein [Alphaproteobacteria bacterium]